MAGCHHGYNVMNLGKLWEIAREREPWSAAVFWVAKYWT